jgi:uncharacterized protein DUF4234
VPNEVYVGRIRSSVTHALLAVVTLGLYFLVWHFLINRDLRRHRGRGSPPALLLLLFLLVPVLGWFLAVWLSAGALRKVQRGADADRLTGRLVPSLWSLVPVIGWAFAGAILQSGSNRAWDRLHRELDHTTGAPTTVECPQCSHRQDILLNPFAPNAVVCPQCGRTGEI